MSLIIRNLTKSFDEKKIFSDFSYEFSPSGIYILKGESGSGKTTLLRIIAGLDKKYKGEVIGGGIGRVGMAFQEYRLFPQLSALENVVFANSNGNSEADYLKAKKMLSDLGFNDDDMQLLPSELSGGMKQRVSLARAFLSSFPILLLDEPTKELDEVNAEAVRELIKAFSNEKLIIMVSHRDEDTKLLRATEIFIKKSL